ncbi:MAG: hypothetical protein WC303_03235 [Candidatus Paceibacterota bacterium]|jgi:hypothetical protein
MDFNKFFQSKTFNAIILLVVALIVLLLVFRLGMMVGFKEANFSYKWGENYYRNFAGPAKDFPNNMMGPDDFMDAHGVMGQIIKIDGSSVVIKDRHETEKVVVINDETVIKNLKQNLELNDLKEGNWIVVIGEPDDSGQISAKLLRILPPPPTNTKNSFRPFLKQGIN